jgi:hypothetical protein
MCFCFTSLQAQDKISQEALAGTWQLVSFEVTGKFYYDLEKDSMALRDKFKKSLINNPDSAEQVNFYRDLSNEMKMEISFLSGDKAMLLRDGENETINYSLKENDTRIEFQKGSVKESMRMKDDLLNMESGMGDGKSQLRLFFRLKQEAIKK